MLLLLQLQWSDARADRIAAAGVRPEMRLSRFDAWMRASLSLASTFGIVCRRTSAAAGRACEAAAAPNNVEVAHRFLVRSGSFGRSSCSWSDIAFLFAIHSSLFKFFFACRIAVVSAASSCEGCELSASNEASIAEHDGLPNMRISLSISVACHAASCGDSFGTGTSAL